MKKSSRKRSTKSKNTSARKTSPKKIPRRKTAHVGPRVGFDEAPQDGHGFMSLLLERVGWKQFQALDTRKNPAGRPAKELSRAQLLVGIIFHYTITCAGTFAEHLLLLAGISMAESSLSQRRQALPESVFEELLRLLLRPLARASEQAFYRGLRLVAVDGTEYSVCNTGKVNKQLGKGRNQKNEWAFAKLRCAVLVELIMHNPLAACMGLHGESEWKLAQGLIGHLPAECLLLADRLYGCGAFIIAAMKRLQEVGGHLLIRVKLGLKVVRKIERLKDGSWLVEIKALQPGDTHKIAETLVVREIHATVRREGCQPLKVRFWTSLLDAEQYPAAELVRLYMSRWEHELYFREIKRELGTNDLLHSQTVETAAQEVASMIIGSSLIAEERSKLKPGEELTHRISFIKTWELLEPLWLTLLLCGDILTEKQKQEMADRFYGLAATRKMAKKRKRSCARVVRIRAHWPRKKNKQPYQKTFQEPVSIRVVSGRS